MNPTTTERVRWTLTAARRRARRVRAGGRKHRGARVSATRCPHRSRSRRRAVPSSATSRPTSRSRWPRSRAARRTTSRSRSSRNCAANRPDVAARFASIDAVAGFINLRLAPAVWQALDRAHRCATAPTSGARCRAASASRSSSAAPIRPDRSSSCKAARSRSATRWRAPSATAATTSSSSGSSTMPARRWRRWAVRSTRATCSTTIPRIAFPEDGYPGEYLVPIAEAIVERDGEKWRNLPEAPIAALRADRPRRDRGRADARPPSVSACTTISGRARKSCATAAGWTKTSTSCARWG